MKNILFLKFYVNLFIENLCNRLFVSFDPRMGLNQPWKVSGWCDLWIDGHDWPVWHWHVFMGDSIHVFRRAHSHEPKATKGRRKTCAPRHKMSRAKAVSSREKTAAGSLPRDTYRLSHPREKDVLAAQATRGLPFLSRAGQTLLGRSKFWSSVVKASFLVSLFTGVATYDMSISNSIHMIFNHVNHILFNSLVNPKRFSNYDFLVRCYSKGVLRRISIDLFVKSLYREETCTNWSKLIR